MCNYLWVVHEPHQASLLRVQYEVTTQELAAALVLLYVQEATDAVLSVHVRHLAAGTFPGLLGPGVEGSGGKAGPGRIPEGQRRKGMCEEGGREQMKNFGCLCGDPLPPFALYLLYLWSLCHLELTRLQTARGSCDTNHNPAFILLYQPHPLSLRVPLFSLVTLHCHSLFSTHPGVLAFSLFFCTPLLSHFLCYLLPTALSSDLASLWPAPSIPSLLPSTAEHPLEHG